MGRNRTKSPEEKDAENENGAPSKTKSKRKASEPQSDDDSESESEQGVKRRSRSSIKEKKRRRKSRHDDDSLSSSSDDYSGSDSESESSEYSSSEEERRRRKRRERRRREEKERRRRKREKEKKRSRKDGDDGEKKKRKKKKKRKDGEKGKKGAVTDSWGKYGVIRETDMWNKRPEFTAWLAEVKKVNLESLPNWEEKQMFKQFMEDHNTATFPSKKYYDLDAYYKHQMEKEMKKGVKNIRQTEMTVFNDEEIRRKEMQQVREKQKQEQVEALMREMQGGMAQAMKEQALLREEMALQYKLGNFEAAAAIQRRLDPDVPM